MCDIRTRQLVGPEPGMYSPFLGFHHVAVREHDISDDRDPEPVHRDVWDHYEIADQREQCERQRDQENQHGWRVKFDVHLPLHFRDRPKGPDLDQTNRFAIRPRRILGLLAPARQCGFIAAPIFAIGSGVEKIAFAKGLIPYIPADRKDRS